jgi:ribosome modulation factor
MCMNFKFSRGYDGCLAVASIGVCCYSNTNSTDVLPEQQTAVRNLWLPDDRGGL